MSFSSSYELTFIPGKFQRRSNFLISQKPVTCVEVEVVASILEENAKRQWLHLADQCGINVPAAQVCETPDEAKNTPKRIRPVEGNRECGNSARARTANRAVIGIGRQVILLADFRQNFFQ